MLRDLDTPQQITENPPSKFLTFLSCTLVHRQAELALAILLRDDREALLSENQQNILDWIRARDAAAFSRGDIIAAFDLPARTIEASVKRLLEYRFIERLGAGRSTRYRYLSATSRKTS